MPNLPDFQIPAVINPENTRCICLQIPDDETWIRNFVGILQMPGYWFNWQRTGDTSGKQCADVWQKLFDEIDWSSMSCCCDQPPAIYRYNSDGVYQRSTDGGTTWTDAPGYDYRNTSTTFPPPSVIGIDNTKCQAADSAVTIINEQIVQAMDDSFAAAQILALIAAVLLALLSAGSLAALTPLIAAIGAAIIDAGVAATKAAFTTAVLNRLRCNIFNHMDTDSSIDTAGWNGVLTQLSSDETGIVYNVLYGVINAAGAIGLTNMIRSNAGDPDADCSGCDECAVTAYWGAGLGTIVKTGTCTWQLTAIVEGDHYAAYVWFDNDTSTFDATKGGICTDHHTISGSVGALGYVESPSGIGHFPTGGITGVCAAQLDFIDANPFVIEVTVGACP